MADESGVEKTVGGIMTRDVAVVEAGQPIADAVKVMAERGIGSLVVVEDGEVTGILTETDLLRYVSSGGDDHMSVADMMSSPAVSVEACTPLLDASEVMHSHGFRRLPIVDGGELVGIVTETDIARAMESTGIWRKVEHVMTKEVVTVGGKDLVVDAARRMTAKNVGSVVVVDGDEVAGILTEKDVLNRVLVGGMDPEKTSVEEVMTSPVLTVDSEMSVYSTSKMMEDGGFRRLPVVEDGELAGIVTQTDLSKAMRSIILEVVPKVEERLKETPLESALEPGMTYLIEEKKPMESYRAFVDMVKHGMVGLCISRTNPERIRENYGLATTPIVWVTDIKTEEPHLTPTDLVGVSNVVSRFIGKMGEGEQGVVFLEPLSYLIEHNDFKRVLHTVQHVRDMISESGCSLIVYIDPVVLTERDLELLMQDMDEVKFRAY